jgi:hypothetical protein
MDLSVADLACCCSLADTDIEAFPAGCGNSADTDSIDIDQGHHNSADIVLEAPSCLHYMLADKRLASAVDFESIDLVDSPFASEVPASRNLEYHRLDRVDLGEVLQFYLDLCLDISLEAVDMDD